MVNMFLLGLLTAVVLFVVGGALLYVGYRLGKKNKPIKQELDEVEQHRLKKFNEDFKEMWFYDVDQALQRKKVTDK